MVTTSLCYMKTRLFILLNLLLIYLNPVSVFKIKLRTKNYLEIVKFYFQI
jgi:hypothetical protein